MKIFTLNYEFPPVGGGGGKVAQDICEILAARGHQVRVQTSYVHGLPRVEWRDGYEIYRSFSFRQRADRCSIPEMAGFILTNLLPTLRQLSQWRPDVVHAHFAVPTGAVAWLARIMTGMPYVLTVHLGDVPGGFPEIEQVFRFLKPFTVPIWKGAACVTGISEHVRRLAQDAYHRDVIAIPNGIELSRHIQSSPEPQNPPRLVFVGRFTTQKNPLLLLESLELIQQLPWEADMLGDGPLWDAARRWIEALGLKDRIRLHGWVSNDEVSRVMQRSDVLLMPSRSEGLSVVGLKALAHGLAIMGSDIDGMKDILLPGINGLACPVNEPAPFAQGLKNLLGNVARLTAMKQASRKHAANFDLNRNVSRYEEIFRRVSSRP